MADIDLDGVEWAPIGNMGDMETYSTMFLGTFDGDNHTISKLLIDGSAAENEIGTTSCMYESADQ